MATTHLLFNPSRGDIKLAQLAVIMAELDWVSRRRHDNHRPSSRTHLPIVFCGDMNFEPFCPLFHFVVDGVVKYAGVSAKSLAGKHDSRTNPKVRNLWPFKDSTLLPPSIGITEKCRKLTAMSSIGDHAQDTSACDSEPPSDGNIYHELHLKSAHHLKCRTTKFAGDTGQASGGGGANENDPDFDPKRYMTTNHDKACENVDFIFFNETLDFELVETMPLPLAGSQPPIPNQRHGSDHYAVAATLALHADPAYCQF